MIEPRQNPPFIDCSTNYDKRIMVGLSKKSRSDIMIDNNSTLKCLPLENREISHHKQTNGCNKTDGPHTETISLDFKEKGSKYFFNDELTENANFNMNSPSNTFKQTVSDTNQTRTTGCFFQQTQIPIPIAHKRCRRYLKPRFQVKQKHQHSVGTIGQHQELVYGVDNEEFFLDLPTKAREYYIQDKARHIKSITSCIKEPQSTEIMCTTPISNCLPSDQTKSNHCDTLDMQSPTPIASRRHKECLRHSNACLQLKPKPRLPLRLNVFPHKPVSSNVIDGFFLGVPTKAREFYLNDQPTGSTSCIGNSFFRDSNCSKIHHTEAITPKTQIHTTIC